MLFRDRQTKYLSNRSFILSNGRGIPFFESNVLGGASVVNGCVHMLGSKKKWENILSKFDVDYDSLLESYNKIYTTDINSKYKINLTPAPQNNIDKAFIQTLNLQNIPAGDLNFSNIESCGPILNTAKKYFRTSVMSIIQKKLFKVKLNEQVENILLNSNDRIIGVKTNLRVINSDYVILAGGVIGSCNLLLKAKHENTKSSMSNLDIGNGIQDHTNLRVNVITKEGFGSINEISNSFYKKLIMAFQYLSGKPSIMKGTGATSGVHLDLNNDGEIDTRIQIVQFTETGRHGSDGKYFSKEPGFSLSITIISPESKGRIHLNNSETIVNPNFLSTQKDNELLRLALKYSLGLLRSSPMSDLILRIEDEYEIEHDATKYIENNIFSGHHLIGGSSEAINANFEVHNTKSLYVCDASIFNKYAASNIHSSVVLIADIFSKKFISNNL